MNLYPYTNTNKRYYTVDFFNKNKFNDKVFKISLNGGFTCPNRDGKVGIGGCIYCSPSGSGDFAGNKEDDLITQFEQIKKIMNHKWHGKYIGYFQANTNTYAPVDELKEKFEKILRLDNVVGLAIATRPDSISDECLEYLKELNEKTYLTIELGLQTIHEETSILINRCHNLDCFTECVKKLRKNNINVVVHLINGLPYETKEMMIENILFLNKLDIQGIKIHMLHILKNTKIAKMYEEKPFHILSHNEYVNIVCDQLEVLNPNIVVHRLTGDPDPNNLIEPTWLTNKITILNDIDKELVRRNTYQGFQKSILNKVKQIIDKHVKYKDLIVDATIGNGNDSLFISNYLKEGHLYGFDIQNKALENTKKLLDENHFTNYTLFLENNKNIEQKLNHLKNKISLVIYNLGYLPGGDKNITTNTEDTIKSLKGSLNLLNHKGIILMTIYPGHLEGKKEGEHIIKYLNENNIHYQIYRNTDNEIAPYLIEINNKINTNK